MFAIIVLLRSTQHRLYFTNYCTIFCVVINIYKWCTKNRATFRIMFRTLIWTWVWYYCIYKHNNINKGRYGNYDSSYYYYTKADYKRFKSSSINNPNFRCMHKIVQLCVKLFFIRNFWQDVAINYHFDASA